MSNSLGIGLIGAGPWARAVTGPVFAAGRGTHLSGVWSRTEASARAAAEPLAARVFAGVDDLIEASDAVAIAVAPDAQPDLAIRCARQRKPVLLEKPLALDLDEARRLVAALDEHRVGSMLMLTYRFHPGFEPFRAASAAFDAEGGWGCFLSGAFLPGSPYARGWRLERGGLLDVGPHVIDLHEAALGPVTDLHAAGDRHGWTSLTLFHESGITSQASICCRTAIESRTELEVFGPAGMLRFDGREGDRRDIGTNIHDAFVRVVRGEPHPADAGRGLHLQELIARAEKQLGG